MSVDLEIQVQSEPVKKTFRIPEDVANLFDQYVKAAMEQVPTANPDIVMTAILEKQIKKDKKFQSWVKEHKANGSK